MTSTTTRAATQTSTLTKIIYVTQKVQADFIAILDTYGYFTLDYARSVIHDVRVLLDEEVIDRVKFVWTVPSSGRVMDEFEYVVIAAGIGQVDDRAGGVRYRPELATADFQVRVVYNDRWVKLAEDQKAAIREDLVLPWGPAGSLDYSGGRWVQDRTYAREGYGLSRRRYTSDV